MTGAHRSKGVWPMNDSGCVIVSGSSTSTRGDNCAPPPSTAAKSASSPSLSSSPTAAERRPRPSIRKYSSSGAHKRDLLRRYHGWKNEQMYLGRYSIEKILAFEQYQQHTSPARVYAVIALTPLPALIIVLILAAIPLESPLLPATSNAAYFAQSWLSFTVVSFGMLLYMRCALALPQCVYSHRECLLISVLTAGANELLMFALSVSWRFPVPLRDILGAPSYAIFFVVFHVAILRAKLRNYYSRIREYLPLWIAQLSSFFIFEGVAILFMNSPVWAKVAITVAFPVLRTILKHAVRRFSHSLEDISTEMSLCVVEVFGSLFQNVCLQSSRSLLVSGLIILLDFVQAIVEVHMHMNHKYVVDGRHCVQTAVKIIKSALFPGDINKEKRRSNSEKVSYKGVSIALASSDIFAQSKNETKTTTRLPRSSKVACLSQGSVGELDMGLIHLGVLDRELLNADPAIPQAPESMLVSSTSRTRRSSIDDVEITHRYHVRLLTQTLELLYASEVLVFAEYSEFVSAFIYGLYTLSAFHLPNAKYSLCFIGLSEGEFWNSVGNCTIYTCLEGCTLYLFFQLVRAKFGISTLYQLGFVLEKYWMSIQGKLVSSLALVFILHTVHQGTDLSLRFDWHHILNPVGR